MKNKPNKRAVPLGFGGELMNEYDDMSREELIAEIERLKEMWNIAYDYGVRVRMDLVTGYIIDHWLEKTE